MAHIRTPRSLPRPADPNRPGRKPLLPRRHGGRHFLCSSCEVTWSGPEADCWSCGHLASSEHPAPTSALQQLLTPITATDTRAGHDRFRGFPKDRR